MHRKWDLIITKQKQKQENKKKIEKVRMKKKWMLDLLSRNDCIRNNIKDQ